MKTLLFLILASAHAEDSWICREEASKRDLNTIWACGVGESTLEAQARKYALEAAYGEFKAICLMDTQCPKMERFVEPKRMTCAEDRAGLWKCTRMIEVRLK